MTKKIFACLAVVGLVALGGPAFAEICTVDDVPAATLLLPYFEVDLDACDTGEGITTLFSVNNASAAAQVAHVTLWTDQSIPSLDFDIYLTGYDVQTLNLRDIFCNGNLPVTADAGTDPEADAIGVGISPRGDLSDDIDFPGTTGPCGNPYSTPALTGDLLAHIQGWHTGGPSPVIGPGNCAGSDYGDNIARGYLTVDVANQCSIQFPSDSGYFAQGGTGIASNNNVLWGDYFYVDTVNNFAQGENLVHVEADAAAFAPGDYTFWGATINPADGPGTAIDNREPLASQFATRFIQGGVFTGGTDLIVWRDSKVFPDTDGFTCGASEVWFPLTQTDAVGFDEQEQPANLCFVEGDNVSPPTGDIQTCFPLEAQRVSLAGNEVPGGNGPDVPFDFGWMFLNLNTDTTAVGGLFGPTSQNWVSTVMSAEGRFSVGYNAIQLDSVCDTQGTAGQVLIPD